MIFRLIKKHFFGNKVVFVFFVLCQIVSLLIALFIFNLLEIKQKYAEYNNYIYRTISVMYDQNESGLRETLNSIADNEFIDDVETVKSRLLYQSMSIDILIYSVKDSQEVIDAGRGISVNDIKENKNVAVVNPKINFDNEYLKIGDSIEVLGESYNVIGFSSSINYIMIPANESVLKQLDGFNIIYKTVLKDNEVECLINSVKTEFPSAAVAKVADAPVETFEIMAEDIMIVLTLVLVNINFVSLYLYILDRDKSTFSIFKMCGCSVKKANRILIGEMGVVCGLAFILAFFVFNLLGRNIYNFMNPMLLYTFSAKATLRTLIAYLFSILLVFLPTIARYNKNAPYQIYSREEI